MKMKNKIITIITAMIFLICIMTTGVLADRTLYDLTGIDVPLDIVAGNTFGANFSFKYLDDFSNPDNSPLIIQLNFTSDNNNYPVWRNDFEVSGKVEKYALWGYIHTGTIYFKCNNSETQVIEHPLDSQTVQAGNGTFYCYDQDADLQLEEHDEVYLNITSHPALWPGQYNLTATMFYLTDGRAPFVNITNKNDFEKYYRENDKVSVVVNVTDGSSISQVYGIADLINGTIDFTNYYIQNEIYYFQEDTPIDILEGDYPLFIFATDENNNLGNDSTTLMIDRTGPTITAIQPNGSIYGEIIPVELSVTDEKAGVNEQSVYYRLREMNGSSICPESGIGTWDCYDSEWIKINLNSTTETYKTEINTTEIGLESGEYWFEAKAEDILGNIGILE